MCVCVHACVCVCVCVIKWVSKVKLHRAASLPSPHTILTLHSTTCVVTPILHVLYVAGEVVDLSEQEPNTVASLLKLYLRELPEPLIPHSKLAGRTDNFSGV